MTEHHTMVDRREIRALVAQMQRKTLTFDELEDHLTARLRGWGIIVIDRPVESEEMDIEHLARRLYATRGSSLNGIREILSAHLQKQRPSVTVEAEDD